MPAKKRMTEAQQDSVMNSKLTNLTTRWNRGRDTTRTIKPPTGTGLAKRVVDTVKNAVRGGNPNPEKSAAWKERQAKIDVAKLRNSGARTRKSGRV